ncbi:MAG: ABC transporter permease subunit [Thaumarchaeota archaeon]|nr:ABC transporter permease subunit [Nitrososphaerota archaeon]
MDLIAPLATLATLGRIFALIGLSIVTGWLLAYASIRNRRFEAAYIPLVNVFESIPVIGFLPLVLVAFVLALPPPFGVEFAVDFLVFDAVAWNIWIGTYQAFKTVPEHLVEVSDNYGFGFFKRMKELYIPHSIPRITSNIFSSFADAFFYISVSEVFTAGAATAKVCPGGTCATFGIGTLITEYLSTGNFLGVYYSLASIAVAVVAVTFALSRLSRWAVAKYGVDTPGAIRRYAGRWRGMVPSPWRAVRAQMRNVSRVAARPRQADLAGEGSRRTGALKYGAYAFVVLILAYLAYSAFRAATSVSASTWYGFLRETPKLLEYVGADYLRVTVIALASLGLAVFAGYFLATHRRTGDAVLPLVQVFAAFPAPAYFPLVFIVTLPFLEHALPFFYSEVYILVLGFLSCFYYVFFDFWIGVQAIPSEFDEVTRNHEIPFMTRMRRVVFPSTMPYLITGLSSTINSAWAGIAIGEFWPNIAPTVAPKGLQVPFGMMYYISSNMADGQIAAAAYVSVIFAVIVALEPCPFTRNLMDLARRKYVIEEGIFAA